jgi:7-carboxy-7-deazaguanine synthase
MRAIPSTPAARVSARAPVMEVFASLQGEGLFAGEPQVFVRLWGCPLRCRWCDTPGSWLLPRAPRARVERAASDRGARGAQREDGWATPFTVATWIAAAEPGPARTVSVTGGEPLLWPAFVRALAALVSPRRVHLETAGAHPAALAEVLAHVDHVSVDLKLPADLDAPVPLAAAPPEGNAHAAAAVHANAEAVPANADEWTSARREVLAQLRGRDACAKLIVAGEREPAAFRPLLDDLAAIAPELPLFVQPVTPVNGVSAPSIELLGALVEQALERRLAVRVLPQVHRMLGIP